MSSKTTMSDEQANFFRAELARTPAAFIPLSVEEIEAELDRRRAAWQRPASPYTRSFTALYQRHVSQAHEGCDFDFLEGTDPVPEPPIY